MNVSGVPYRTIWCAAPGEDVAIIDQTKLPHEFVTRTLRSLEDAAEAIEVMRVRGAPLIGAAAAYGMALALRQDCEDRSLRGAYDRLLATRPTAVNLRWALDEVMARVRERRSHERVDLAYAVAAEICDDDVATCRSIGQHGAAVLRDLHDNGAEVVNILTHCNAGWLATVDWGTALAPVYVAHDAGIPVHVWVDETRPRNQGAALTAWELAMHGVPHTVVVDNAGGHLMQHQQVDVCITGTDRTTATGDVCNKIGTYLKALAARDNGVPFYVGLPHSTIDWTLTDGLSGIPIEQRNPEEVIWVAGRTDAGEIVRVNIAPAHTRAVNYAFDVTPAALISGLITERGICDASAEGLRRLYPGRNPEASLL